MPFRFTVNRHFGGSAGDKQQVTRELDALRAELDDLRTKYTALQAALTAGTAPGAAGYPSASVALAAARFTP
jgi:hypothetical protein